jgi:hypothetical protein
MTLNILFNLVVKYTSKYYKDGAQDERCLWREVLEDFVSPYDSGVLEAGWFRGTQKGGIIYECVTERALDLVEYEINGKGEKRRVDRDHFAIKQMSIPLEKRPNLRTILEVAYYAGLLKSHLKIRSFPEGFVKCYEAEFCDKLIAFVDPKNWDDLKLTEDMPSFLESKFKKFLKEK